MRHAAVLLLASAALVGCDGSPARPDSAPLTLEIPSAVPGRYVTCGTCESALSVAIEFPVTVGDPSGPGGTVQEVRLTATDQSRGTTLASNSRPNADVAFDNTTVPAGGRLQLPAGLVIAPAPPPRDAVVVAVLVRLADGRSVTSSAALALTSE